MTRMSISTKQIDRRSAKISKNVLDEYRVWAEASRRSLSSLLEEALSFALGKKAEVERLLRARALNGETK